MAKTVIKTRVPSARLAIVPLCCLCLLVLPGCSSNGKNDQNGSKQYTITQPYDPEMVQARTMTFADRYLAAIATAYDEAELASTTNEGRITAQRCKLYGGMGAMANAVNPNPIAGLMDMAIMVRASRELAGQPWFRDVCGAKSAASVISQLSRQEDDVYSIVGDYLTPPQVGELRALADTWVKDHPDQRFVVGARLSELFQAQSAENGNANNLSVQNLANGVVSLVRLDPFKGLDPAVQQLEQSRILAERAFFYLQHMPLLVSWQTDLLYSQLLANPQTTQVLQDTTTIAGSTTRFTDSTLRVSDATTRVAESIEKFRQELPHQQDVLMDQVGQIVNKQRDAALVQASTQVSQITSDTVTQLNSTLTTQQDALTQNLQGVMNQSIDRLYSRVRSLILIVAGTFVAAILLYRFLAGLFFKSKSR